MSCSKVEKQPVPKFTDPTDPFGTRTLPNPLVRTNPNPFLAELKKVAILKNMELEKAIPEQSVAYA